MSDHPLDAVRVQGRRQVRTSSRWRTWSVSSMFATITALAHHLDLPGRRFQSVFHVRSDALHPVLAMRSRVRRYPGNFRADDRGARLQFVDVPGPASALYRFRMRLVRRLRAGLPDRRADGKDACWRRAVGDRAIVDHLRLLRRRMLLQGRGARRRNRAHGAEQGRLAQPWPFVRQGTLCMGLRDPSGSRAHADDPQAHPAIRGRRFRGTKRSRYAASAASKRVQKKYGRGSLGGITSSRCTNEEAYLVQKLVRAAFGNNNVDTCARVCHSPTGYGLKTAFGTPAGTKDFDSVHETDVIMVIGANPTEGHPVFSSIMKRRLREGARLIVADPRADRIGPDAACRGGLFSPAHARHQCRAAQCDGACRGDRGPRRREFHQRALQADRVSTLARLHRRGTQLARGGGENHRRAGRENSRRRAALRRTVPTPRFTMASASPSTARAAPRCSR